MPLHKSTLEIDAVPNASKVWAFIVGPLLALAVYFLLPDAFVNVSGAEVPFTNAARACAAVTTLIAFCGSPKRSRSP